MVRRRAKVISRSLEGRGQPERLRHGVLGVRPPGRSRRPVRRPCRAPRSRCPTTGLPIFSASAISESVPNSPCTAITTSAVRTTIALRASPIPVATAIVRYGLASSRESLGRIPTERPPASAQPPAAASITPPMPPQTRTAPASATPPPDGLAERELGRRPRRRSARRRRRPSRVIPHSAAPYPSIAASNDTAPALSSGSLPLPHLGDCTHEGQPRGHGHERHGLERRLQPSPGGGEPPFGDAGAARVAVVHEDRARAGVGMVRGRDAADVPPVARRDQREQADRRVLGGVGRPRERRRSDPRPDRAPSAGCAHQTALRLERLRRQVERHDLEDLAGGDVLAGERDDLVVTRTVPKNVSVSAESRRRSSLDPPPRCRSCRAPACSSRGRRRATSATCASRSSSRTSNCSPWCR